MAGKNLESLPNECLLKIMSYLSNYDVLRNVAVVSKRFHNLSQDKHLIRKIVVDSETWTKIQEGKYYEELLKIIKNSVKLTFLSFNFGQTGKKELNFQGTKEELCDQFFCVNAYDRQFFPQFKEVNNCLAVNTVMFGFWEETIPFKVSITFFIENRVIYIIEDNVYPITESKDFILQMSTNCPLKRLTGNNQPKIDFCLKIFSPELDEIAKNKHVESGM